MKGRRVFTTYQIVSIIVAHGFQKVRSLRTQSGEYRYQAKDLTEAEWLIFDIGGEDLTDAEKESLCEPGGWMILDHFTASAVKQVYEALSEAAREKFDTIPLQRLAAFAFQHAS